MKAIVLRQHGHTGGSGATLARALGIPNSSPETSRRMRGDRFVINYGCSVDPGLNWRQRSITFTNSPQSVHNCADKRETFRKMLVAKQSNPALHFLEWTDDRTVAAGWVRDDGKAIGRSVINGHSGVGISVLRAANNVPNLPLYTRYFKKDIEYRVHVAFGRVALIQQKKRGERYNGDDPDLALIRTNANGWIFSINDLDCDVRNYRGLIETLALNAAQAVGIQHGAVEILVKHKRQGAPDAVVCEINSAPALGNPSTLNAYVQAFRAKFQELGIRV